MLFLLIVSAIGIGCRILVAILARGHPELNTHDQVSHGVRQHLK